MPVDACLVNSLPRYDAFPQSLSLRSPILHRAAFSYCRCKGLAEAVSFLFRLATPPPPPPPPSGRLALVMVVVEMLLGLLVPMLASFYPTQTRIRSVKAPLLHLSNVKALMPYVRSEELSKLPTKALKPAQPNIEALTGGSLDLVSRLYVP